MDAFLQSVGAYLVSRGDFAVIAGVEAVVIYRLATLLLKSMETRITERAAAEERAYKAMSERAAELEKAREQLLKRGGRG